MESNVLYRMQCANNILFAIWDAMDRDAFSAGTYADAVYGVYDYLTMLLEELNRTMEKTARQEEEKPEGIS